ncbi:alpha-L-fucosidase [Paenibacillus sp. YAF4_2]|uniref:alpha-L-fucosidase n=1 Tax=Paenibacillus sp. YAF4_2 TaxID=3233085 RepID=UPI003F9B1AA4
MLIQVVAKGGNLTLNITPLPDGRLPKRGVALMLELGGFLKDYGESIYGTRAYEPYISGELAFTRKGSSIYVFYQYADDHAQAAGTIKFPVTFDVKSVQLLGVDLLVDFRRVDGELELSLPPRQWDKAPYADVFCIEICP